MIKRTLYFGNPAYLSVKLCQLEIRLPEVEKNSTLPESFKASAVKHVPIEDIGVVVLDNKQVTITQGAFNVSKSQIQKQITTKNKSATSRKRCI